MQLTTMCPRFFCIQCWPGHDSSLHACARKKKDDVGCFVLVLLLIAWNLGGTMDALHQRMLRAQWLCNSSELHGSNKKYFSLSLVALCRLECEAMFQILRVYDVLFVNCDCSISICAKRHIESHEQCIVYCSHCACLEAVKFAAIVMSKDRAERHWASWFVQFSFIDRIVTLPRKWSFANWYWPVFLPHLTVLGGQSDHLQISA